MCILIIPLVDLHTLNLLVILEWILKLLAKLINAPYLQAFHTTLFWNSRFYKECLVIFSSIKVEIMHGRVGYTVVVDLGEEINIEFEDGEENFQILLVKDIQKHWRKSRWKFLLLIRDPKSLDSDWFVQVKPSEYSSQNITTLHESQFIKIRSLVIVILTHLYVFPAVIEFKEQVFQLPHVSHNPKEQPELYLWINTQLHILRCDRYVNLAQAFTVRKALYQCIDLLRIYSESLQDQGLQIKTLHCSLNQRPKLLITYW